MSHYKNKRIWAGTFLVLLILLLAGWYIYYSHIQNEIKVVTNVSKTKFELITVLIEERLQKRNYDLAKSFVLNWGENVPEITEIILTTKNGYGLAHYNSQKTAQHTLIETIDIPYSYNNIATLELHRSVDNVYLSQKNLMYQLLTGYVIIAAILCFLVQIILRTKNQQQELILENERRRKIEASLEESKQDLAITLNSIGDAVITTDVEGNVTRMNPVAENLTGWSFKEAQGQPLDDIFVIISASTHAPLINPVKKVLSTGITIYLSNDTTLIAKDGTERQIADSAAPIQNGDNNILGAVLVFNDVTEQYKLRESAAKSKRDMQMVMDFSPAVIYIKDTEGRHTFLNKRFEDVFKIKPGSMIGKTTHDMFPKDIADEMQHHDHQVLAAGYAMDFEEIVPQDDGLHSYNTIKFPLFNEKGNVYALCGISTDITKRKLQEEQIRRTHKMDALGKLTGGIAHDYNNMLGIVIGYAEMLGVALSDQPKLAKYANEILRASNRGAKLSKRLLNFSNIKTSDATVLYINTQLQYLQNMLEKTLTPRIDLKLDLTKDLWPVYLNDSEMEDAIINISINAMHAIDGAGQLTFKTSNEPINATDSLSLQMDEGDYVLLSITDTGCGMDETIIENMFDPFYSTKGDLGTGLGLCQVYGFVKRSHGMIKVYSKPGQGTKIDLYFPRYFASVRVDKPENEDIKEDLTGKETILVVDDEAPLLKVTTLILKQQGYHVISAENAKQALLILENEPVDLLLSDIVMPEMNGYQLAAIVQEKYPAIKLQLASGFTNDHHDDMINNPLHQNLLYKPYHSHSLLKRIRELLDS